MCVREEERDGEKNKKWIWFHGFSVLIGYEAALQIEVLLPVAVIANVVRKFSS